MIRIGAYIFEFFAHIFAIFLGGDEGVFFSIMISASRFITVHGVGLFMALWMWIGTALCMKTSRGNEYQADEFSCRLGYGQGLMETLLSFGKGARPEGLFAALASSHPATEERVARIQTLMAQYGGGR
jgi:heat shock protein HtpX